MQEFEILKRWKRQSEDPMVHCAQGDDCSVVDFSDTHFLVSSTDVLVEDVHFRRQTFQFTEMAYKALAVNISDLSAMGASPRWAHLTLAIPSDITENQVDDFFKSFYDLSEKNGITLLGGDLSKSPQSLFINVHISGLVEKTKIKYRAGLSNGVLCVSGPLGLSSAGLYCLENQIDKPSLIKAHKNPPIETSMATWLSEQSGVLGMMDISDGLLSDLQRVGPASIRVDLNQVPTSTEVSRLCAEQNLNSWQFVLAGGEDYRLLYTVDRKQMDEFTRAYRTQWQSEVQVIGESSPGNFAVEWHQDGHSVPLDLKSFQHFE